MTVYKVPDVGQHVLFEGHTYVVVMHKNGKSVLQPVDPATATFKRVTCNPADLTKTVEGEYQKMVERDADNFERREKNGYGRHVAQMLTRKMEARHFDVAPWVLPFRHIIRTRHWDRQRDKGGV